MLRLLAGGDALAPSIFAAAGRVAPRAKGASRASAQRRLARKFRQRFGRRPPASQTWADVEQELNSNSSGK
jgi:hypothetical protein